MGMFGIRVFDNSQRPLVEKIRQAAKSLLEKHKRQAELCVVHPSLVADGQDLSMVSEEVGMPVILSAPSLPVPPGHLFVGRDEPYPFSRETLRY